MADPIEVQITTQPAVSTVSNQIRQDVTELSPSEDAVFDSQAAQDVATQAALDLKLKFESVATFSAIGASTDKRMILVESDETNDNEPTFYMHDGTQLQWIITQTV